MKLSSMDVKKLMQNPSSVSRSELAEKVAYSYSLGDFRDKESEIAVEILRLLVLDAEKSVRETLAENLYASPNVPRDIIFKLACDEASISEKILQFSSVLNDDDLLAIINSTKEVVKLSAIARRNNVSEKVSEGLLNSRQVEVLSVLMKNNGAVLGERSLQAVWSMVEKENSLLRILANRGGLPITIVEKLYSAVTDELKLRIANQYRFNSPILQKAALDAREWEMLGLVPIGGITNPDDDEKVEDLVEHLASAGRLTHSLIIRSLCMGAVNLFETTFAKMAGVPRVNARLLLMGGSQSFRAIYQASNMPDGFEQAVEKLLGIVLELTEYGYYKPDDFRKRVIEEVYIKGYHRTVDGMGYLLSIIGGRINAGSSAAIA